MKVTGRVESYELNNLNLKGRSKPYYIMPDDIKAAMKNFPPGMIVTLTIEKGIAKGMAEATPAESKSYLDDEKAGIGMNPPPTEKPFKSGKEILEQNLKEKVAESAAKPPAQASAQNPPPKGNDTHSGSGSPDPVTNPPKEDIWSKECEEFKTLLRSTKRDGIEDLLKYLEESTDFYIAPSSTKYHDANAGGLLHHSIKVYHNLVTLSKTFSEDYPDESLIIIGLLHDLCKTNFYKISTRNVKHENCVIPGCQCRYNNGWNKDPYIDIDDQFPLGHGEKSVILLQRHIKLTDLEIMAIRWHMMAYDDVKNSYAGNLAITNASDKYRIIPLFHMADLAASFLELRAGESS